MILNQNSKKKKKKMVRTEFYGKICFARKCLKWTKNGVFLHFFERFFEIIF